MAIESMAARMAGDLAALMGRVDEARVLAMLACKAERLDADDARTVFHTLQCILDEVHNGVDVAQEMLEAGA